MRQRHIAALASLALLMAALAACKKEPPPAPPPAAPPPAAQAPAAAPFAVTQVELGKQIGADKRVAEQLAVFAPTDTIYATVLSNGTSPNVTLKARWLFETASWSTSRARRSRRPAPPSPSSTSPNPAAGRPANTRSRSPPTTRW